MRIKTIQLSWFRGAADPVSLEPDCKSMVVYGENGSGKSSFVDGVEFVLSKGRIGHLAHEYSGKHQEKGIINTHKPQDRATELRIKFKDGSELKTQIKPNGLSTSSGAETVAMETWEYRCTILRQDEVAQFIHDSKGAKYSALLPLIGLDQLEVIAENLRQLAKAVETESKLIQTRTMLTQVETKRKTVFGTDTDVEIFSRLEDLWQKYCTSKAPMQDMLCLCADLEAAINKRIASLSADQRQHLILADVAGLRVKDNVVAVRTADADLSGAVEPLIHEKLNVLLSANKFAGALTDETEVKCPACGQVVTVDSFRTHIQAERERLEQVIKAFETRKAAIGSLCDTVKCLKLSFDKADVKPWRDEHSQNGLRDSFAHLDRVNAEVLRESCTEEDLKALEEGLLPLIVAAASASQGTAPDARGHLDAQQKVGAGKAVIEAKDQAAAVKRAEALISFINHLERGVREELRQRSQTVIDEISADVQAMWSILHPGERITDVRLYLPEEADKAIDISLKFHGAEQNSPRLTLSEGNRNSLGLCIFLAMAKRQAYTDRPLILDDVIVSLDRNHRGMIVELLEKIFKGRQVVILTHDREWYTELRHLLGDDNNWVFKTLLPYDTPEIGIRWSHKTTTFGDARAHLSARPDSAGNDARKIMDIELALIAERLQVRLQYFRGEKNDQRLAHEFLERLVADGSKCFQKRVDKIYTDHADAIAALREADRLLLAWGNRASHTFNLKRSEAIKLIDVCERALEYFKCSTCGKAVWFVGNSKTTQCECSEIRWRYGK
ncbi:MAG: AAA family ATPase [Chloroflexi bacterium]|nr:AAA family ATPase [Chloroflexota bacterium]